MNGHATRLACEMILARLVKYAANQLGSPNISLKNERVYDGGADTGLTWPALLEKAYWQRINLSAHAFYATPHIYFDKSTEKGEPFSYHVHGAALVQATVDCLLGRYTIDTVKVVHDAGKSLHAKIDLGQIQGGIVQGLGWMTMEEVLHDQNGKLLTDTLTTYKIPDIDFAPDIAVEFLTESANSGGPFNSKAVGEPPFMYGIAAYFALFNAMKAFKPDLVNFFTTPMTPEKVLLALYPDFDDKQK